MGVNKRFDVSLEGKGGGGEGLFKFCCCPRRDFKHIESGALKNAAPSIRGGGILVT